MFHGIRNCDDVRCNGLKQYRLCGMEEKKMYAPEGIQHDANKRQEEIERLRKELDKTTNPERKAEILRQIKQLEDFEFLP